MRAALPAAAAGLWLALAWPAGAHGQDPPPDTVDVPPADTLEAPAADTLDLPSDSLPPDSLPSDSVTVDSLPPPPVLPALLDPSPAGAVPGGWEWDREALLAARSQTLRGLLSGVPGLLAVRNGDFGSPAAAFPVGYSGGGLRVFYDGVEHLPLEGSVPDLSRVALSGLERVRVVRRAGGLEVHLHRFVHADARPHSLIEAGTGDQNTNVLRGVFSVPRALWGKASLAVERLDTQGREDPGAVTGGWFRYSLHRGDRGGARFEYRRMASQRTDTAFAPSSATRSDWTVQGAWALGDGLLAESWVTGASVSSGDTAAAFPFAAEGRRQYGARLTARRGAVWGRATGRFNGGAGVADRELSAEASAVSARWGGANGRLWHEAWDGNSGSGYDLRAWATPVSVRGLSLDLFAERGAGRRSVPYLLPLPVEPDSAGAPGGDDMAGAGEDSLASATPRSRFTDRAHTRYGVRLAWRGLEAEGARMHAEADSVWPTGLPFDRGGLVLPQPRRTGWELGGRIPLWPRGLSLRGTVQLWEPADSSGALSGASSGALYFPDHLYDGGLSFHRVFRSTGNFELWVDLGAQGRSAMSVPRPARPPPADAAAPPSPTSAAAAGDDEPEFVPSVVPFYQDWYFRLQMRILSLHVFLTIENLTLRENNQDVPGRLLPGTRSLYGVRWTMWN